MQKNKNLFTDNSTFVVAEASANHGQSFKRAVELIKKARECGADAVKFQAYTPGTLTINCTNKYFQIKHPQWKGQTLYQLYKETYTPWRWFKKLKKVATDLGIIFFATAFDKTAVDFLEEIDVPMHKVASFELVDLPLIEYIAQTKKPIILSTGMASIFEIREAVNTAKKAGAKKIILLKCVSDYPAKPSEINLITIPHMKKLFGLPIGISDHTLGTGISLAALTLGAEVIEKHFTLSRDIRTADSFFSIEPKEMKDLVDNVRRIEEALGTVKYGPARQEKINLAFRRSLFAVEDIKKGERFTLCNTRAIRPGYGLLPKYLKYILGKKARRFIKRGSPLIWGMFK